MSSVQHLRQYSQREFPIAPGHIESVEDALRAEIMVHRVSDGVKIPIGNVLDFENLELVCTDMDETLSVPGLDIGAESLMLKVLRAQRFMKDTDEFFLETTLPNNGYQQLLEEGLNHSDEDIRTKCEKLEAAVHNARILRTCIQMALDFGNDLDREEVLVDQFLAVMYMIDKLIMKLQGVSFTTYDEEGQIFFQRIRYNHGEHIDVAGEIVSEMLNTHEDVEHTIGLTNLGEFKEQIRMTRPDIAQLLDGMKSLETEVKQTKAIRMNPVTTAIMRKAAAHGAEIAIDTTNHNALALQVSRQDPRLHIVGKDSIAYPVVGHVYGTNLATDENGIFGLTITGPSVYGQEKVVQMRNLEAETGKQVKFGAGDSNGDREMLQAIIDQGGLAMVVRPTYEDAMVHSLTRALIEHAHKIGRNPDECIVIATADPSCVSYAAMPEETSHTTYTAI